MPFYECVLATDALAKDKLISCIKRVGLHLLNSNAVIRKVEYLGTKPMYTNITKVRRHDHARHVSHFIYFCDLPPNQVKPVIDKSLLDKQIHKMSFTLVGDLVPDDYECTLEEEMLVPSYRPSIQKLIKEGRPLKEVYQTNDDRW